MPWSCFSYPANVPTGIDSDDAARSAPAGLRRMVTTHCFCCPADVPTGTGTRSAAQSASPGLPRKTNSACFRY